MPTITISRLTGSDNGEFARELARKLGYDFVDKAEILKAMGGGNTAITDYIKEILREPSKRLIPIITALRAVEKSGEIDQYLNNMFKDHDHLYHLCDFWYGNALYDTAGKSKSKPEQKPIKHKEAIADYQQIIKRLAERGKVVIVGRGAQAILKDVPWALHLRLTASPGVRIINIVERCKISEEKAEEYMGLSDKLRAQFVKENFGVDWDDPQLYHMTITMDRWKSYLLADAVAAIVKSETFRATTNDLRKHYKWPVGDIGLIRRGI